MNKRPGGSKDFGRRGDFAKKHGRDDKRQDRPDRPARGPGKEQRDNNDRPDRSGRPERPARPDRAGRPERPGRQDRSGRPGRFDRTDRSDRPDYADRPDRQGAPERKDFRRGPERQDGRNRPQRQDWQDRPARPSQKSAEKSFDRRDNEHSAAPAEDERLIIKGRHEVLQALEGGQTIDSVVISTAVKGPVGGQIRELASHRHIPVKELGPDLFERKFGAKSQGVAAIGGVFEYCELADLIDRLPQGRRILVALNHVEDPRNLGAIVRTVEASGCGGVIIPKHRAAGMTEWAIRTAQGAAAHLPVARVNNMGTALEQLKESGFWVVGLEGSAEKKYDELMYNSDVVLVAGGEDAGLGERIQRVCDDLVAIPLIGKTPSLNVSVSTAVVLYEILRQRRFFQK